MIKLNFSPVRAGEKTELSVTGSTITVNGESFELSDIPGGSTVQHSVIQNCTRTGDDYELTVTLLHGANAPQETRFPQSVEINTNDWALDYVYEPEVSE